MKTPALRYLLIALGIFYVLVGLFEFLFSKFPLDLLVISFGMVLLILGVTKKEDLFKKKFNLLFLVVVLFQGAVFISTYLFTPQYVFEIQFKISISGYILLIIFIIYFIFKNRDR
jgi:uncharacterized membrane protein HdeD (DUF308 family)